MECHEIFDFVRNNPTTDGITIHCKNNTVETGFLKVHRDSGTTFKNNLWEFTSNHDAIKFFPSKGVEYTRIIKGEDIEKLIS